MTTVPPDAPLAIDEGIVYQLQVCRRPVAGGIWTHVCAPQDWAQTPIARLAALAQSYQRLAQTHAATQQQLLGAEATLEMLRADMATPQEHAADERADWEKERADWEQERQRLRAEVQRLVEAHADLLAAMRTPPPAPPAPEPEPEPPLLLAAMRILPPEEAAPAESEPLPFDEVPEAPEAPRYPCPHCHREFFRPGARTTHIEQTHAASDVPSYPCKHPGCTATFARQVGATQHYRRAHAHSKAALDAEGQAFKADLDRSADKADHVPSTWQCADCGISGAVITPSIADKTRCIGCVTAARRSNDHVATALA
jgi:hypothetical protein